MKTTAMKTTAGAANECPDDKDISSDELDSVLDRLNRSKQ